MGSRSPTRGDVMKQSAALLMLGLAVLVLDERAARGQADDLSAWRGRTGWKGPIEEWYWLIGNPRRIGPDFFYGDDPFIDLAVRPNAHNRRLLYDIKPPRLAYRPGTHPVLEEVVREVTRNCTTDAQRAEALLQWVHHMRTDPKGEKGRFVPRLPAQLPEDPTAPEHILKNGGGSCEWVTRLFVSLAQVAGIPARLVMRRVHTQAEVCLDGKWVSCCPLMGDHGERFLNQPPGKFAGKPALEVYDLADSKQEFALARHYLGEQRKVQWLELKPAVKEGKPRSPLPAGQPVLAASFGEEPLPLKPIPQPGPPEPLYMVPPRWSVKQGRARIDFAPGLFFHLNQAVAGEERWRDVGVAVTLWREPRPREAPGLAGIVYRSRGPNFNAVLLQDERAVLVVRVEDGWKTRVLAAFPWPLARTEPARLYVRCHRELTDVWLDDRYLGRAQGGLWPAGQVGLAAVQTASFDDFRVWLDPPELPAPPAAIEPAMTDDLVVTDVLEWDRFLLDVPLPARRCKPEYSIDNGRTWQTVPADHLLGEVDPRPARIRFRLHRPAGAGDTRLGVEYRVSTALKLVETGRP